MKREGMFKIKSQGCHILVGTPGRLQDILSDPYNGIQAPNLSAFVLDEADRLLDQGFSQAIQDIQKYLPKRSERDRQTLLFSATIPKEVMSMVRQIMKPDFKMVRTVKEGEQETHTRVSQKVVFVRGFENLMPAVAELCKRELQKSTGQPFKAIIYFGTTNDVALAASTFAACKQAGETFSTRNVFYPASIIEMHGRLTQNQRTQAADAFRRSKSGILLSSDVTARGMDFPNVTHVIQMGVPQAREDYVHRIGRTARASQGGEGWLILTDLEKSEARHRLRDLPLVLDTSLETARIDMSRDAELSASAAETLTQTIEASKFVPQSLKNASYASALGIYGWVPDKHRFIESMNARAKYCWGMENPPPVSPGIASKLGYLNVPGVVIGYTRDRDQSGDSHSQFGRSMGRGGSGFGGRGGSQGSSWQGRGRSEGQGGFSRDREFGGGRDRGFGGSRDRGFGGGRDRDRGFGGRQGGQQERGGSSPW